MPGVPTPPQAVSPTAPTVSTTPTAPTAPAAQTVPVAPGGAAGTPVATETAPTGEELVYLNVQDADIRDVIKQISKATLRNFIIDDKVKGKVTIISEKPLTREEAYQTFLSALEVAGFTIVKGPAGVIKVVPLKDAVKQPIPTHVDTTPVTDSFITRLIALQNISAVEMSNAIKGLVSAEGNLFAYPATNTLIITDSGTNIDRLMKIIKELDQEGPQQVLEIVPVRNATARDIAQMVKQLFEQQKTAKAPAGKKGGELEEMEEVSQIIPDERTNAVIVLASRRAIDKVRGIIAKLDRKMEEGQEGRIHVYYLKHAKAKTMADTLSNLVSGAGAKKDAKAAAGGAGSAPALVEFEGGMKITADEGTNSLVITATPKDYQTLIDRVISKLDISRRQVYLEAVVMELTVKKSSQYGVGGFGGAALKRFSVFGSDPSTGPGLLSSFMAGTAPALPAGLIGGLIGRDTIPITIGNTTREIPSAGIFVSAMSNYGDANVISTPSILTTDNEEAKIEVMETEYYNTASNTTSGGQTNYTTNTSEAGLTLKITPQIGEGDNISLKILQELSDFSGPPAAANLPKPKKKRAVQTAVVTKDAQTVVIGGLMEDKTTNVKTKIPILGDIPILGNLFKQTSVAKNKVNLLVFITPHIVKDPTDFEGVLKRKIEERNKFIEQNYGKKQQKIIRESIKNHREDLLEFKTGFGAPTSAQSIAPTAVPTAVPVKAPAPVPVKAPTSVAVPQAVQAAPAGKPPVITVGQQPDAELGDVKKSTTPAKPLATVEEQTTPKATVPAVQPGRVKAPVITTPPPTPGSRKDELNLSY
jgi:general secretion pathway protein D